MCASTFPSALQSRASSAAVAIAPPTPPRSPSSSLSTNWTGSRPHRGRNIIERLNAPTEWTQRATSHFRDTSRGLARVLASHGAGMGGALLTLRFDIDPGGENGARTNLTALLQQLVASHQIVGAHLCVTDDAASGQRTAESRDRTDISAPPAWIILIEACTVAALDSVRDAISQQIGSPVIAGNYLFEFALLPGDR